MLRVRDGVGVCSVQVVAVAAPEHQQVELSNMEQDPSLFELPAGYHWYETMMVLRPTLNDEER